jgi:hypothetical protein
MALEQKLLNNAITAHHFLKTIETDVQLYKDCPRYGIPYSEIAYQIRIAKHKESYNPKITPYAMLKDQLTHFSTDNPNISEKNTQSTVKLLLESYYDLLLQHIAKEYASVEKEPWCAIQ